MTSLHQPLATFEQFSTGYNKHIGNGAPAPADTPVWVYLGDGEPFVEAAGVLNWGPGLGPNGAGRILRWAPVAIPHT